ncbi:SGNH/GDSL hydrolase family protein [Niallia taxi]|uniref:SGNH/GDSL hydrolase family protein n=1 Tax=Niallia taxi TaxID=2499688 RepID=UPI002E1C9CDE|nr:SGNH/GDSL hydrolase family protein [Niallia taxi]MED4118072.1 SGNH/GDSL hydrolase family protein [Niallia taxi]
MADAPLILDNDYLDEAYPKINEAIKKVNSPFGNFVLISDSIDFNTNTKILSWPSTYVFGGSSKRIALPSGTLELKSFGNNAVIVFFDTIEQELIGRYATDEALDSDIYLGILFLSNLQGSTLNFKLTVNGSPLKSLSTQRTSFGRYVYVVDPIDYNTTTKVLSWGNTNIFGASLARTGISAGSLDLTGFGGNVPALYFNTDSNTIVAKYVTDAAGENDIFLGILWTTSLSRSMLCFKLTVNGAAQLIASSDISSLGKYGYISDPVDYNTTTKVLSWPDSYLFGAGLSRIRLNAGSLDLSGYTGVVVLFFNTTTGLIEARSATMTSSDNLLFLGIFWLGKPGISNVNFDLTFNGTSINNRFFNKKWAVMGDSITNYNEYQPIVNQIIGFKTITNYGVGGTCLASTGESDTATMSYRIKNIDFTADIITVFGGTNDWGNIPAKPLGQFGDTVNTTVYGAIEDIINTVLTNAPLARLAFITPLQRNFTNSSTTTVHGWSGDTTNELGYKLEDVVNAIKEVCGKYGIPVLDLYHTSGITKYNLPQMTRDGLHPNTDIGMVRIGKQIAAFLKSL